MEGLRCVDESIQRTSVQDNDRNVRSYATGLLIIMTCGRKQDAVHLNNICREVRDFRGQTIDARSTIPFFDTDAKQTV